MPSQSCEPRLVSNQVVAEDSLSGSLPDATTNPTELPQGSLQAQSDDLQTVESFSNLPGAVTAQSQGLLPAACGESTEDPLGVDALLQSLQATISAVDSAGDGKDLAGIGNDPTAGSLPALPTEPSESADDPLGMDAPGRDSLPPMLDNDLSGRLPSLATERSESGMQRSESGRTDPLGMDALAEAELQAASSSTRLPGSVPRHSSGSSEARVIGVPVDPLQVGNCMEVGLAATGLRTLSQEMSENTWIEYEGVLTTWEKKMLDKVCPFKRLREKISKRAGRHGHDAPTESTTDDGHDAQDDKHLHKHAHKHHHHHRRPTTKHKWWEGLSDSVPERYQRWEGIRERNTILSLVFGLCGYGRKQPTKFERVQLFILYASVWYLAYSVSLRRRGRPCRKGWVEACVPLALGGGCDASLYNCSSAATLALSPPGYDDYDAMMSATRHAMDLEKADCVKSGTAPCSVPLCAMEGPSCERRRDNPSGFCSCNAWHSLVVWETILYTVLFKLIYIPFWYLFIMDLEVSFNRTALWCTRVVVIFFYGIILILAGVILWNYMDSAEGFAWETMFWFLSFFFLCCFEVVKSFTLGHLIGSYVIRPLFGPWAAAVWKFLLA